MWDRGLVAVETAWVSVMGTRLRRKKHETAAAMTTVLLTHSLSLSSLRVPVSLHGKVP